MDALHFCIAIVPVSAYLMMIGLINLSPRPFVTTGMRDLSALAIAVAGFVIVGPMELFLPETVASIVGSWVWLPLMLLYALTVSFALLMLRPRLIVYNMRADQLRPILHDISVELDADQQWAGDSLVIPNLGVQLAIEAYPGVRNVSLVAVGAEQDLDGWHRLKIALKDKLSTSVQPVNPQGLSFILLSSVLAAATIYQLMNGTQEIAQSMKDMLRL